MTFSKSPRLLVDLNLTESRVCQIHSNILTRLKEQLKKNRQELLT